MLRERAVAVDVFDDALEELARSMVETMYRERGIGLAGPQVGERKCILVALQMDDTDDVEADPIALINPVVLERSRETWLHEEGCLSIPGVVGDVTRAERITVRYQDPSGAEHELATSGMFARVLLHEIDHLDGKLFIDYLSPAKKSLIKPRLKEISELNSP